MEVREALNRLEELLSGVTDVVILPHNDPDPDAIAGAAGLSFLLQQRYGVEASIWYNGIIGRAENRALVEYLDVELHLIDGALPTQPMMLVDTQPQAGNNPLPPEATVLAVIDHHPLHDSLESVPLVDVRPELGATSTIVTHYLREAQLMPDTRLATALFYGIKSDTMSLARPVDEADVRAYVYLRTLADNEALLDIEQSQVAPAYFRSFSTALKAARVYEDVLIADVGAMSYPDMVAEVADWLLRLQGTRWVICFGAYGDTLRLAVRTRRRHGGAGQVAQAIVGRGGMAGGHSSMAGGQVPLRGREPAAVAQRLRRRALEQFGLSPEMGRELLQN
jgi:nanoRNase/pAp phosphatase (c-di-AMP/oligoRNAs hydrolase)